jgi:uncharacterized coiled-coil protein SlyX
LFGSKLSRYQSIAELEEVKTTIGKVIEFLRTASYEETAWLGYQSNHDGIAILQRNIRDIDEEIEKRKHWSYGLKNNLMIGFLGYSSQYNIETRKDDLKELEQRIDKKMQVLDKKVNDSMTEFHNDMEKNMPDVRHVAKYLRGMEENLGDPDDELEES